MNAYIKLCVNTLEANKYAEPTEKEYPTYLKAYKSRGRNAEPPYFEDMHYVWRNYKPND